MGIAPKKPAERVTFYLNKTKATGPWKVNSTAIGSSVAAIDALNVLSLAADAALQDQQAKRDAAKTSTQNAKQAVRAMSEAGSDVLAAVKAKAAVAGDAIYTLADIPEPATPSPVAAPGTPSDFKVEIVQNGALKLSWKCANPSNAHGTVYQIARQIGASGTPVIIGSMGRRSFIDATLPAGATAAVGGVTYEVTALRSTKTGLPGAWTVRIGGAGGAGGAGEMTVTPAGGTPKLAA